MRRPAVLRSGAVLLVFLLLLGAVPARAQQSEADVFVAQAILAYEDKRYDEALVHLREALTQDPKNVEALYYTGLVYVAQQRLDQATQVLEQAHALAPDDFSVGYLLGVTYFAQEKYDLADPLLTKAFKERPNTEGLGYYVGFMRYRQKNYAGALEAFKAETSPDPALKQLTHFYSGLALAVMGLPERAASELDAATRSDTPTALTGPAERLRDSFAAGGGGGNRLHAEIRFGYTYDTNVKVLPQPSNDPLANAVRFIDTNSPGQFLSLTVSYDWFRSGPWESTIGYQFFQTWVNDFSDFNVQDQVGTLGVTYRGAIESGALSGVRYLAGAQYVFDNQTLGGDQFLQRNTGTLFATFQWNSAGTSFWNPTHVTTPILRFQGKNFTNVTQIPIPPTDNRDANNSMVGISHAFFWSGDRHWFRVGYQWDTDSAQGSNWDYRGNRVQTGVQYTLPWWETRAGYSMDVHFANYLNKNTLFPITNPGTIKRSDIEQVHIFSLEQPLPWLTRREGRGTRVPLSLRAEYQIGVTTSDIAIYKYDRNVFSISISYLY
ncbi:MAG TPA: tetratricopeptide repeat protein [Candidatus Bathyarchaeia archaeon]|nr:tetratricopeptide repeat protein [Candidatus Bathyarchaeia archaeon]